MAINLFKLCLLALHKDNLLPPASQFIYQGKKSEFIALDPCEEYT